MLDYLKMCARELQLIQAQFQAFEDELYSNPEIAGQMPRLDPTLTQGFDRSLQEMEFIAGFLEMAGESENCNDHSRMAEYLQTSRFVSMASKFQQPE
ncbi:hypothetical protein VK792_14610 [Mesobacterium sp. TK19101]|uniref:Uncharacterized protein n=1 Tax=Mesobacterium hydrothermale TaxID=3111907 RepID=A0ABU6HJI6_9RHOB|nr:hypothetical protein [Mesobacterium sp. TK19101]MEC3862522.1 hypothetical protein [Mesobacterium sp. TK19101]